MTPATHQPNRRDGSPQDDPSVDLRMGSEYSTARTYLARRPQLAGPVEADVPVHGANDTDFAGSDPLSD